MSDVRLLFIINSIFLIIFKITSILCWDKGEVYLHYYLSYHGYLPKNFTNKLKLVKRSMIESGFENFHLEFALLKYHIINGDDSSSEFDERDTMTMLTFDQLFFFFVVYIIEIIIAILVFVIELIVYRLKAARKREEGIEWL